MPESLVSGSSLEFYSTSILFFRFYSILEFYSTSILFFLFYSILEFYSTFIVRFADHFAVAVYSFYNSLLMVILNGLIRIQSNFIFNLLAVYTQRNCLLLPVKLTEITPYLQFSN